MRKRQIELPDGRYLIYYDFSDEKRESSPSKREKAGPDPKNDKPSAPR